MDVTLADIFPDCSVVPRTRGWQLARLTSAEEIPEEVSMDDPEDRVCIIDAIKSACQGTASVFKLAQGHPGAEILAVLPLSGKQCMLLGIKPHGGSSDKDSVVQRQLGHAKRMREGIRSFLAMPFNVCGAFLYVTHDPFVAKEVQEVLHYSRRSQPEEDEAAVYLMFVVRTCLLPSEESEDMDIETAESHWDTLKSASWSCGKLNQVAKWR